MLVVRLLAYDGNEDNQRQGKLGIILHDFSKWMIRGMTDKVHAKMKPVINYKRENGWLKDHIKAMEEGWKWVISLDELPLNHSIGGFKGADDKNRKFFLQAGEIAFTHLDEDTFYDIHFLLWLKWIHEHWDRFEQSAEAAYQILNFENLYKDLLEWSKPLPQDENEQDEKEINYIEMEKKLIGDEDAEKR